MSDDLWIEPSQEQNDQALLVQMEILEAVNRMGREGFPAPIIIAGIGAAVCDVITKIYGNQMVPSWFQKQAEMTAALIGKKH